MSELPPDIQYGTVNWKREVLNWISKANAYLRSNRIVPDNQSVFARQTANGILLSSDSGAVLPNNKNNWRLDTSFSVSLEENGADSFLLCVCKDSLRRLYPSSFPEEAGSVYYDKEYIVKSKRFTVSRNQLAKPQFIYLVKRYGGSGTYNPIAFSLVLSDIFNLESPLNRKVAKIWLVNGYPKIERYLTDDLTIPFTRTGYRMELVHKFSGTESETEPYSDIFNKQLLIVYAGGLIVDDEKYMNYSSTPEVMELEDGHNFLYMKLSADDGGSNFKYEYELSSRSLEGQNNYGRIRYHRMAELVKKNGCYSEILKIVSGEINLSFYPQELQCPKIRYNPIDDTVIIEPGSVSIGGVICGYDGGTFPAGIFWTYTGGLIKLCVKHYTEYFPSTINEFGKPIIYTGGEPEGRGSTIYCTLGRLVSSNNKKCIAVCYNLNPALDDIHSLYVRSQDDRLILDYLKQNVERGLSELKSEDQSMSERITECEIRLSSLEKTVQNLIDRINN